MSEITSEFLRQLADDCDKHPTHGYFAKHLRAAANEIDRLRESELKLRKILAYVPAKIAIEAKEKAGYPTVIRAMGADEQ